MKTKLLLTISLAVVLCSAAIAQKKPALISPDVVVKNLYTAHNSKRSPFFQTKDRALVRRFFTRAFADAIWKDAVETNKGEVGTLGFDPLYNAQDTKITRFKIAKPMYGEGNVDIADVEVSFRNFTTAEKILFRLERSRDKKWLVDNISYPSNGSSLRTLLEEAESGVEGSISSIDGQLHFGKFNSYILYFGKETGDYAAYCFTNASDVGRSILAACKDGDQCEVAGEVADASVSECKAPGLEADLSARGKIVSVKSVKSRGKQQ